MNSSLPPQPAPEASAAITSPPELPSLPTPNTKLADFPDWFSPALVKDLRRGLKMRGFMLTFLGLVIVLTVLSAGLMGWEADSEAISIIWIPISVVLFIIQPLRGLNAISEERKLETLPLIQLTRLNSLKILIGKWTALAFQTGLIAIALLPYFVLGHFLGGFEFVLNVLALIGYTVLSLLLTALMVATSVLPNMVVRILVALAVLITSFISSTSLFSMILFEGFGVTAAELSGIVLAMFLVSAFLIYYLLSAGGSQLAIPGSENHSTLRRLVALGVVLLLTLTAVVMNHFYDSVSWDMDPALITLIVCVMFMAVVVVVDCLVDPAGTSVRTVKQLRGWPQFFAFFAAPGWPFGWMFAFVFIAVAIITTSIAHLEWYASTTEETFLWIVLQLNGFAALLWPAALAVLAPKFRIQPLLRYVIYLLAFVLVASLLALLAGLANQQWMLAFSPVTNLFLIFEEYDYGDVDGAILSLILTLPHLLIPAIILFVCADSLRHRFRQQIQEARRIARGETEEAIPPRAEEGEY